MGSIPWGQLSAESVVGTIFLLIIIVIVRARPWRDWGAGGSHSNGTDKPLPARWEIRIGEIVSLALRNNATPLCVEVDKVLSARIGDPEEAMYKAMRRLMYDDEFENFLARVLQKALKGEIERMILGFESERSKRQRGGD